MPEIMVYCSFCDAEVDPRDILSIRAWLSTLRSVNTLPAQDSNNLIACGSCLDSLEATVCGECETLRANCEYVASVNVRVCDDCIANCYGSCENCNWVSRLSIMVNNLCDECYGELHEDYDDCDCGDCEDDYVDTNIRPWHNNPVLKFISDSGSKYQDSSKYYLGLEIELEQAYNIINNAIPEFKNLWASTDASLGSQGVEVISMPGTLEAWNAGKLIDWDLWNAKIHSQIPTQTSIQSNGIHVHVSRTAFNNAKGYPSPAHLYKFMMFIQHNKHAVQYLANRKGHEDYCIWGGIRDLKSRKSEAKKDDSGAYLSRYRPINTRNEDTIEIRIFNGRSDPAFIQRAYQFVASIVEFTRNRPSRLGFKWVDYTEFVVKHTKEYPSLARFLLGAEKTLLRLSKQALNDWDRTVIKELKHQKQEEQALRTSRQAISGPLIGDCDCRYCMAEREGR